MRDRGRENRRSWPTSGHFKVCKFNEGLPRQIGRSGIKETTGHIRAEKERTRRVENGVRLVDVGSGLVGMESRRRGRGWAGEEGGEGGREGG